MYNVNLATYRQFKNAVWDWIIYKKEKKNKNKKQTTKTKQKPEKKYQNCIKSGLSQSLFLQQKI